MTKKNDTTPKADNTKQKAEPNPYATAQRRLREAHLDEFNALVSEEYAKVGKTYKPRPTEEQKQAKEAAEKAERERKAAERKAERDAKKLAKFLEDNPSLAAKIAVITDPPADPEEPGEVDQQF